MKILQLVSNLSYGDAVSNDVLAIDNVLRRHGYHSMICAQNIDKRIRRRIIPFSICPRLRKDDILIYHMAIASEMTEYVERANCICVLRYHNITPPDFFEEYDPLSAMACYEGIEQVRQMRDAIDFCLPVSKYNASDLSSYGYRCPMRVVPIVIPFKDYRQKADEETYHAFHDGKTNILFLGRIVPNKKIEDIIESYYYYHRYWNPNSRLILVGNCHEKDPYYGRLKKFIARNEIPDVIFTGHISFKEILAYYRAADAFLCMSEHEGFCVPLVESMLFDVPIIAYRSCAVPETVGDAGILIEKKDPIEAGATVHYLMGHEGMRKELVRRGRKRVKDFLPKTVEKNLMDCMGAIEKIGR